MKIEVVDSPAGATVRGTDTEIVADRVLEVYRGSSTLLTPTVR